MPLRRLSPRGAALTAAALSLALAVPVSGAGAQAPPGAVAPQVGDPADGLGPVTATVTLVTGHRVSLHGDPADDPVVSVTDAAGRHTGGYAVHRDEEGVRVVPHEVTPLVGEVLDPELFNVTRLVELGHDDESSDVLPLLVRTGGGLRTLSAEGFEVDLRLESIDAVAGELRKEDAADFLAGLAGRAGVSALTEDGTQVWLDGTVEATALDHYLGQVSAPAAWDLGLDGEGVTIAVLDTGVDAGHPDLAGQVMAAANFTDDEDVDDHHGHGTHVASLAAGTGAGNDGERQGVAPGAQIISGKVLNDHGEGQESWVIAGLEWAVEQGADVVNLSLSGDPDGQNPVDVALEELAAGSDTLFVAAAGNGGAVTGASYTIGTPGTSPSALTVGAVQADDVLARFSSRGPTSGDFRLKPDLVAPGVELLGARAGARDGDLYTPMSGTSMSTPVVVGAAALLRQQHPDWTAEQVKARLMHSASGNGWYNAWSHGAGRLDLAAATSTGLLASRPSLDLGLIHWPHEGTVEETVTITNPGAEDVAIETDVFLEAELTVPAPDGAISVTPVTATVPAGGSVEVTVTIDLDPLGIRGWQGILTVAGDEGSTLRIPVGAFLEPESYQLDLQVIDANGDPWNPAAGAGEVGVDPTIPIFNGVTGGFIRLHPDENGQVSARVPAGEWMVLARVYTPDPDGGPGTITVTGTPGLTVEEDTSYVLDAREGQPLEVPDVAGHDTAPQVAVPFIYSRTSASRGYGEIVYHDPAAVADGRVRYTPTAPVEHGGFEAVTRWWLEPTGPARGKGADLYDVLSSRPVLDAGLTPDVTAEDLRSRPRLDQVFHPVGRDPSYVVAHLSTARQLHVAFGLGAEVTTPGVREVLLHAPEGQPWAECLTAAGNDHRQLCGAVPELGEGDRARRPFAATLHPIVKEAWHSADSLHVSVGASDGVHDGPLGVTAVAASTLELRDADDAVLDTVEGTFAYFRGRTEPGRFRLVQELEAVPGEFSPMTRARTVWEFSSRPPGEDDGFSTQPTLLGIDYGLELPADGGVGARPVPMELRVLPTTGTAPAERVEQVSLEVSADDGRTWREVGVRRSGPTSFRATLTPALVRGAEHLSFRVAAVDAAGNAIEQTTSRLVEVSRGR